MAAVPSSDAILSSLNGCDLAIFESSIEQLSSLVLDASSKRNPLIEYFNVAWEEDKLIQLSLLDSTSQGFFIKFVRKNLNPFIVNDVTRYWIG